MIELVISGGQSGADQAGWRAARRFGIKTGGWMPRGYLTEDGPRPEFAAMYGAQAHESREYPPRTRANVRSSSLTILFGDPTSAGAKLVCGAAGVFDRPVIFVSHTSAPKITALAIRNHGPRTVNIAGNRESKAPGIGAWVESFLCDVFRALGHVEVAAHVDPPAEPKETR